MRLLHTSDWHLGASDHDRSLQEDQKYFIDAICSLIRKEKIDAVMIAGDVYDHPLASAQAISLYNDAMKRICLEEGIPVLMIAGNHDSAERLASCRELLESSGLYIAGTLEAEPKCVRLDDADVYLLPWITEERVRSLYPEETIRSLTDAYRIVTSRMRRTFREGKKHLCVSHAFITGSELSESDKAAQIGFATQVPASVFEGFDYVALGHIHKPQNVTEQIRYSGTPMPYAFGAEEKQEKSVTVYDTATGQQEILPLPVLRKRTTFRGTLTEVLAPDASEAEITGYVRVIITDSYIGPETLSRLREVYPNLMEAAGKTFENENASVTLTMEEFEKLETDPREVFRYFCREEIGENAEGHYMALFEAAMQKTEEDRP